MDHLLWTRPAACANSGNCPEVAMADDGVYIRSSLVPDGIAQLTTAEWRDLVEKITWRKPSICGDGNNCPEVAITADGVLIRSSLVPDGIARLTTAEWRDLVAAIRSGEFDL